MSFISSSGGSSSFRRLWVYWQLRNSGLGYFGSSDYRFGFNIFPSLIETTHQLDILLRKTFQAWQFGFQLLADSGDGPRPPVAFARMLGDVATDTIIERQLLMVDHLRRPCLTFQDGGLDRLNGHPDVRCNRIVVFSANSTITHNPTFIWNLIYHYLFSIPLSV